MAEVGGATFGAAVRPGRSGSPPVGRAAAVRRGLPVPLDVPLVDLAVVLGLPRFAEVLEAVLDEIVVEHAWVSEGADGTPAGGWVDERLAAPAERLEHEELKAMVRRASLVVRTGEATAYANVVLRCGVPIAV